MFKVDRFLLLAMLCMVSLTVFSSQKQEGTKEPELKTNPLTELPRVVSEQGLCKGSPQGSNGDLRQESSISTHGGCADLRSLKGLQGK